MTIRELPAEAQLSVALGPLDIEVTMLVVSRVERVPVARPAAVLARFAGYLASSCAERFPPVLAVLARTPRVAERALTTADTLGAAPAARHLEEEVIATARRRVVAEVVEPHPVGLSTQPVWATPVDRRARRLVEVLTEHEGSAK